jgi:hypothetical protein
MKQWRFILVCVIAVFAVLQAFNPAPVNPPVTADLVAAMHPPAAVAAALHAACYDCHSNATRWPLYARVAPVSWLIASDVKAGRQHLNFSEWPAEPARAARDLDRVNEVVDYREMPPRKYALLHADARLDEAQRKAVLDWTSQSADAVRPVTKP